MAISQRNTHGNNGEDVDDEGDLPACQTWKWGADAMGNHPGHSDVRPAKKRGGGGVSPFSIDQQTDYLCIIFTASAPVVYKEL